MTLKIGTARKAITPEIGTLLAGYDANVVSDGIRDDLYISGIALSILLALSRYFITCK